MKFPFEKKSGIAKVTFYRNNNQNRPAGYDYKIAYYDEGKRRFRSCATFSEAETVAKEILERANRGEMDILKLSKDDLVAFTRAKKALKKLGLTIDHVAKEYASAFKHLPQDASIVEVARDHARRHPANMPKKTVQEVVDELIAAKTKAKLSERHIQDLKYRLGAFAEAFQCQIASVTSATFKAYLESKDQAPRTLKNHLNSLSNLFEFAKDCKYLPQDFDALGGVKKTIHGTETIYPLKTIDKRNSSPKLLLKSDKLKK